MARRMLGRAFVSLGLWPSSGGVWRRVGVGNLQRARGHPLLAAVGLAIDYDLHAACRIGHAGREAAHYLAVLLDGHRARSAEEGLGEHALPAVEARRVRLHV